MSFGSFFPHSLYRMMMLIFCGLGILLFLLYTGREQTTTRKPTILVPTKFFANTLLKQGRRYGMYDLHTTVSIVYTRRYGYSTKAVTYGLHNTGTKYPIRTCGTVYTQGRTQGDRTQRAARARAACLHGVPSPLAFHPKQKTTIGARRAGGPAGGVLSWEGGTNASSSDVLQSPLN